MIEDDISSIFKDKLAAGSSWADQVRIKSTPSKLKMRMKSICSCWMDDTQLDHGRPAFGVLLPRSLHAKGNTCSMQPQ